MKFVKKNMSKNLHDLINYMYLCKQLYKMFIN